MKRNSIDKIIFLLAMIIFGTIGLARKYIPYSSGLLALSRAVIGVGFLLVFMLIRKEKFTKDKLKSNLWKLILSGVMIGGNWILLFEAYRYTTVSVATICYYMAPVFVILLAPFLLKEKMTVKKGICSFIALVGMAFVSGVIENGFSGIKGVVFGLLAACLYAAVMIMNKKIEGLTAFERTIFQLGSAAVSIVPYVIITEDFSKIEISPFAISMVVLVGIVHTGVAYALYFGSMAKVPAQTAALLSYVDPVVAVLLSAFVLREKISVIAIVGVVLVLGSALVSEWKEPDGKKPEKTMD